MQNSIPNFFIIGAPKSGTTTLHGLLGQHPQVFMCEPKEPRFFSRDSEYKKGFDWYCDTYFKSSENYKVRGEATPTYLFLHNKTIPRIKHTIKNSKVKFIAILRNPVDRAYSHYWFNRNTKFNQKENLSFEEALFAEEQRFVENKELYEEGRVSYAYFQIGLYDIQVKSFIAEFGEKQCLWLLFEDLLPKNFKKTVDNLEHFLEIEEISLAYTKQKESVRYHSKLLVSLIRQSTTLRKSFSFLLPKKLRGNLKKAIVDSNSIKYQYPEMNSTTRQTLKDKYKPSIDELEKIIKRNLSHWV